MHRVSETPLYTKSSFSVVNGLLILKCPSLLSAMGEIWVSTSSPPFTTSQLKCNIICSNNCLGTLWCPDTPTRIERRSDCCELGIMSSETDPTTVLWVSVYFDPNLHVSVLISEIRLLLQLNLVEDYRLILAVKKPVTNIHRITTWHCLQFPSSTISLKPLTLL